MTHAMRLVLEIGPKGKKVVAVAPDWPGLARGAKNEEAAVERRAAPLAVYVSSANRHDKCSLQDLVCSMVVDRPDSEQHLCLDRGYDYSDIWEFLNLEHYVSHIKHRRRRGEPEPDPCPIPGEARHPARRWVVERTFSWLAKRRSIRTRWCKKAVNWLALLQFACAHVTFNMAFSG